MKKSNFNSTDLVCLECGNVTSIMRKNGRGKKVSHRKHLWCYKCMKVTEHYEVHDASNFMWRDTKDEMELLVKDLIENGKNDSQKGPDRVFTKVLKK